MARPSRTAALYHALLVAFALEGAWGVQGPMRFDLDVDSRKGSWTLKLGGETWAESQALPRLHADGHWLSLQLSSSSATPPNASGTSITYKDTATGTEVLETSFELSHDGLQATFTQCVLTELSNTALSPLPKLAKDHVLSSFPSFATTGSGAKLARGFFAYHGQMVGGMEDGTFYGVWGRDGIPSDTSVGPIVVFAQDLGAGAVVFGPALNVMATTTAFNASANLLEFGLMGSITRVPAGTCSSTVAVAAATPTMAVKRYGDNLLKASGKKGMAWESKTDVSLQKISLGTQNGAYDYYNSGPFPSEQDILEAQLLNSTPSGDEPFPFGSVLLDSWWYPKGPKGGVEEWVATNETFPRGLASFQDKIKRPIIAHNRYWSSKTVYALENGGRYHFIVEPMNNLAIPTEQQFWDDLLANATHAWGLSVYEQDWLHNEWEGMDATLQNATLSATWLRQMGTGAAKAGINIQYCMAYPRFAIASTGVAAVDQIRVSDDYRVDITHLRNRSVNLYVGTSSLLAAALGLAPYKDVFWSSQYQPGFPSDYPKNTSEPFSELEAVVSIYTAGPVSAGDGFGYTNNSLLAKTCTAKGTLLKPSWPAVPIDEYHLQRATGTGGPQGELNVAPSLIPSVGGAALQWVGFYAMDLKAAYALDVAKTFGEALGGASSNGWLVYRTPLVSGTSTVPVLESGESVDLAACGKADYHLMTATAAAGPSTLTLLGEVGKFVAVSPVRFRAVAAGSAGAHATLNVTVAGDEGERVEVAFARPAAAGSSHATVGTASCTVGGAGECSISVSERLSL